MAERKTSADSEVRQEWLGKEYFKSKPNLANNAEFKALMSISGGMTVADDVLDIIGVTNNVLQISLIDWNSVGADKRVNEFRDEKYEFCLGLLAGRQIQREGYEGNSAEMFEFYKEVLDKAVQLEGWKQEFGGKHGGA